MMQQQTEPFIVEDDDSFFEVSSMEVTHDEYQRQVSSNSLMMMEARNESPPMTKTKSKPPSIPGRRLLKSLKKSYKLSPKKDDHQQGGGVFSEKTSTSSSSQQQQQHAMDALSLNGVTVASNDETVQMSNKKLVANQKKKSLKKKISHLIKKKSSSQIDPYNVLSASPNRRRSETDPDALLKGQQQQQDSAALKREQSLLDDAIRGRNDGMDVLSLGSARLSSVDSTEQNDLQQPITASLKLSAHQMVTDLMWTSGGRGYPEMVLEGFIPGGDDRWNVRMEIASLSQRRNSGGTTKPSPRSSPVASTLKKTLSPPTSPAGTTSSTYSSFCAATSPFEDEQEDEEEGVLVGPVDVDEVTPIAVLLKSMWGNDPTPPTHMSRVATDTTSDESSEEEEGDILQMAASCSVPIDVDEDTLVIDTAAHLQAVHDICAEPIKNGRYDDALEIFSKIVKGLQGGHEEERRRPIHLIGSTLHNMGIVQMWQCKYHDALDSFERAITEREGLLPKNHVDIAVSYLREGLALFALESFEMALQSFTTSLEICKVENATRAKILNNIGVVHYQRKDVMAALVSFTQALEIQRNCLEGPVRRASIVFDASITLSNMGKVYMEKKDYDTALYVYEEALLLQTTCFRKDHDIVIISLGNLAYAKAMIGDLAKSIQIYKGVLRFQETTYGYHSSQAVETMGLLALLHQKSGNLKDAHRNWTTVLKWQQANLPPNHPSRLATQQFLQNCSAEESSVWI